MITFLVILLVWFYVIGIFSAAYGLNITKQEPTPKFLTMFAILWPICLTIIVIFMYREWKENKIRRKIRKSVRHLV